MQTLCESELSYTQDHKLDLNGIARTLLEDVVNTVMVEQVEEPGCVRNGQCERKLVTAAGTLTLKIPKLREGTYFRRYRKQVEQICHSPCKLYL